MSGRFILITLLLFLHTLFSSAQVRIRVFADSSPRMAVLRVTSGNYVIKTRKNSEGIHAGCDTDVIISRYNRQIAVKINNTRGFVCDSLIFIGLTGNDRFSLRVKGASPESKYYSGDIYCYSNASSLVFVNSCNIDEYIAGVVEAEGGTGNDIEYLKAQAIIVRTYLYRNINRHLSEGYNLCDGTHCQAFNGLSGNRDINLAVTLTKGLVILDHDKYPIEAAFHSNCGGETNSSEDVWSNAEPYLEQVRDPFCHYSRNASWVKKISLGDWVNMLERSGYNGRTGDPSVFRFVQKNRLTNYAAGSFNIPLSNLRDAFKLRSTFFSVYPGRDSLILKGKGYGHGVGLCQEGAMVMARKGFNFKQIIDFYYKGVIITDIKNAVILPDDFVSESKKPGKASANGYSEPY
jgi:stage II sporulation protein D